VTAEVLSDDAGRPEAASGDSSSETTLFRTAPGIEPHQGLEVLCGPSPPNPGRRPWTTSATRP